MIVPRSSVIELDMTVEEALKHIVSMGSVPPGVRTNAPSLTKNRDS
jgi:uncharacterized membrane protein